MSWTQAVHLKCPKGEGATHHLVSTRAGKTPNGDPNYEMRCQYCGRTQAEIEAEANAA